MEEPTQRLAWSLTSPFFDGLFASRQKLRANTVSLHFSGDGESPESPLQIFFRDGQVCGWELFSFDFTNTLLLGGEVI